jgi:hypothetical protein
MSKDELMRGWNILAEKPLIFGRDPESGCVVLVYFSSFHSPAGTIETPLGVVLSMEAAKALLADLQELRTLLVEATTTPSKPTTVQ